MYKRVITGSSFTRTRPERGTGKISKPAKIKAPAKADLRKVKKVYFID